MVVNEQARDSEPDLPADLLERLRQQVGATSSLVDPEEHVWLVAARVVAARSGEKEEASSGE